LVGQIKEAEANTSARIDGVTADLVSIKSEVASSRYDLQQTVSELKRVTGDLGVQSDYIATNTKELQALRSLGERNYFDFHLERTGKPQRREHIKPGPILVRPVIKVSRARLDKMAARRHATIFNFRRRNRQRAHIDWRSLRRTRATRLAFQLFMRPL
jgi:hypothetical protein